MKFKDLKLNGKTVMAVGGSTEAYQLTKCFVDSGATIWVISKTFTPELVKLGEARKVALLKTEIKDAEAFVDSLNPKPYVLIVATDDSKLDADLAKVAKNYGSFVYAADDQSLRDFMLP